jgi:beta-phosphoglucomutase-like phosphatase (HAD superfamily)
MSLLRKGFLEFIDGYFSNEDVKNPKPKTEIYLKCMIDAGVDPDECLIVEDSIVGRKAALKSGGNLHPVLNTNDINLEKIIERQEFCLFEHEHSIYLTEKTMQELT